MGVSGKVVCRIDPPLCFVRYALQELARKLQYVAPGGALSSRGIARSVWVYSCAFMIEHLHITLSHKLHLSQFGCTAVITS